MKATLLQWLRMHPLKAVLFATVFSSLATSAAFREDWFWTIIGIYAFVLFGWIFTFIFDMRRATPFLLAIALCLPSGAAEPPSPPRQDGAGLAVGAIVICVGGYCVYRIVKVCQKLFPKEKPKDTNSEPGSLTFTVDGGDEYGASWNYGSIGSCVDATDGDTLNSNSIELTNDTYVATLKITVSEWGQVTSSISAGKDTDKSQSQNWLEFQQEVASHGLVVTGIGNGSKYYSRNRIPCGPESVPIEFDEMTKSVVHTGGSPNRMWTISIERSRDFQDWTHFLTVQSPYDTGFEVQDLTRYGQMFYRVRVQ